MRGEGVRHARPSVPSRRGRGYPAGVGGGLVEQLLERLDLEQQQAQVEEHVDDLCAGDEITAPETLQASSTTWVSSCWFMG